MDFKSLGVSFGLVGGLGGGLAVLAGCGDAGDQGIQNPPRDLYDDWIKVEPPGLVCGNDTQYKFFVNFSNTSDNVAVVLEPGGACWDYPSCTGAAGIRGAANPEGIPDNHYAMAPFISPFLQRADDTSPTADWNLVYVPYCTGDVHTGNNVITYTDPDGVKPDVTTHHAGHDDVQSVVQWIDDHFTSIPKLLVTGCSAGGVGSLTNYMYLRRNLHQVKQGYMLDDSGPIFPSDGFSGPLHAEIRAAWNIDSLAGDFPPGFDVDDFGSLNTALADEFPDDRLATTFFRRDYNFSLYSYERFYDIHSRQDIFDKWESDTQKLVTQYDTRDNLFYYIPYWRDINSSHCTTVLSFAGSDIQDQGLTLGGWLGDFINDRPVHSAIEAPVAGEDPEPQP